MNDTPTNKEVMDAVLDLRDAVAAGFAQTPSRAEMNARFEQVDARLDRVDARLDRVDARLDQVDVRLDRLERRVENLENRVDDGFAGIEARLKTRKR